jgi:anti-sigma factor RsiW
MNVTREIVKDLLPLYVAGEASADTRALVESFLARDPELARLADAMRAAEPSSQAAAPGPPPAYRAALEKTRRLLRLRARLFGFAILFTLLPLSFEISDNGFSFIVFRQAPAVAVLMWIVAAGLWIAYANVVKKTRVSGL